jgi:proton-translocating NADH-quinone oxidoreductase chain N
MSAVPVLAYAPEMLVLAAALVAFLLDSAGVARRAAYAGSSLLLYAVAFAIILGDLGTPGLGALSTVPAGILGGPAQGPVVFTSLGLIFQGIFLGATLLVTLASWSDPDGETGVPVFYALVSLATLGMLLVALSADLIFLLLAVEVTGISTYVLVAYTRNDSRSLEAAMKFYIIGALSTAISFFGASLVYGAYGTTSLAGIASGVPHPSSLALVGYGLLGVGLGFKATVVPFHMWAVDVYDGAPHTVSAFLASSTKKMGIFTYFVVFLSATRVFGAAFGYPIYLILGTLAVLTMTVGNVLALQQQTLKRMLAYSSISQAGYMLLGIAIATPAALSGATLLVLAHVLMKGGAFLVVAAAAQAGLGPSIQDYRGLGYTRPALAVSFSILLLSLAGIPLTLGFVGKFYVFTAAVQAGQYFVALAVAGLLNSALSVFYYARILRIMYMSEGSAAEPSPVEGTPTAGLPLGRSSRGTLAGPLPRGMWWSRVAEEWRTLGAARWIAIVGAAALTVILGIYPTPLVHALNQAAYQFWHLGY